MNSLSWLHVVWEKNFYSTGTLSLEDRSMTIILLRMYAHIDTGKRFNILKDRKDPMVFATRSKEHQLGYTGFSLDDFNGVNRDKKCSFKTRFGQVFNKQWTYTQFKNVFLIPISGICDALYQSKVPFSFISDSLKRTFVLTIVHINLGVTTNLRNKGLSVSQVEDWKVTIPSFDLFPTIPLTFDEVYWEAYWGIVNKPASVVRDVMIKLERETREKEKMAMNKQKLEQDVQKQQEKLVLRKKRRIIESPTQSPYPKSTENTPEKNNSLDNSEQPQYMHNNLEEVRLKKRKKSSNHPFHWHHPTHLILPLLQ